MQNKPVIIPKGPIPNCVTEFLKANPELPKEMMICDTHGKWYVQIDHLCPTYWDACKCSDCMKERPQFTGKDFANDVQKTISPDKEGE